MVLGSKFVFIPDEHISISSIDKKKSLLDKPYLPWLTHNHHDHQPLSLACSLAHDKQSL